MKSARLTVSEKWGRDRLSERSRPTSDRLRKLFKLAIISSKSGLARSARRLCGATLPRCSSPADIGGYVYRINIPPERPDAPGRSTGGHIMAALEKGNTASGTGNRGKTRNIPRPDYFPKAGTESTF